MKDLPKITLFLALPALTAGGFLVIFHYFFSNTPLGMGLTIGILWTSMFFTGLYLWGDGQVRIKFKKKLSPILNFFRFLFFAIFCISTLLIFITLAMDYLSPKPQPSPRTIQNLPTE